ncbi:MAG: phosphopantothenoylcysteine decarboxylase [Omnitrophica bacterium]|nr:phosphopantothenoylcysteine decarboxylase [Candidatus Omnitrophota bacterium]
MKRKNRLKILVTAGPTREPIDPVRFISNYSTGLLGYEVAREAKKRGHRVILISGPSPLAKPKGIPATDVLTAHQMEKELKKKFSWCNCLVMTAAIGDFRAEKIARTKIKRSKDRLILKLTRNPDILSALGRVKGRRMLVGCALETEGLRANAQAKLKTKKLDLIVATQMKASSYPFGQARLDALMIDKPGKIRKIGMVTKRRLAGILLDTVEKTCYT